MTDPWHIVSVSDFSRETLQRIVAHLEVSTQFEHLVYREAELDAIWSITGLFLKSERDSDQRDIVERLHKAAHEAPSGGRNLRGAVLGFQYTPGVHKNRVRLAIIPARLRRAQTR